MRKGPSDICDVKHDEKKSVFFFIIFPLLSQIQRLFERPDFIQNLQYKQKRIKIHEDNIEDIIDGEVYKDVERQFDPSCFNITLTLNSDGMQIFNSSSYSLWPCYLVINELPPKKRKLSENVLLAGIWGSTSKPHPNVYLMPMYKELKTLHNGVFVKVHGEEEPQKVVAQCICGCFDAPARACFMNMKTHAGFFSCPKCVIKGEKPGAATVFPYEEHVPLRNLTQYNEHVKLAVDKKIIVTKSSQHEEKCCGIKGPSVYSHMVPNMFSSTATDSMHCIYMGVVKAMLTLWFDKEFKEQPFSCFSKLHIVSERLYELTPPHILHRLPQGVDKLIYWKATELRSFFFNLSLVILHDILKPEYFNHLALFVKGVALLNSSSISQEDLILSSLLLNQFVSQFSLLYGPNHMSHNLHMILHLERSVRLLGPLWAVSCFEFEDLNGRLANLIHGTRHVGLQIYRNLSIITKLPLMVDNLQESRVKEFCTSILQKKYRLHIQEQISLGVYCAGVLKDASEKYSWVIDLLNCSNILSQSSVVHLFSRLLKNGILYVAQCYKRTKRVSSYVKYTQGNCSLYGRVDCFVRVSCSCSSPCVCKRKYLAVIKRKPVSILEIQGLLLSHLFQHECTPDCESPRDCDVVNVQDLQTVMFQIDVKDKIYLSEPLNPFELQ